MKERHLFCFPESRRPEPTDRGFYWVFWAFPPRLLSYMLGLAHTVLLPPLLLLLLTN